MTIVTLLNSWMVSPSLPPSPTSPPPPPTPPLPVTISEHFSMGTHPVPDKRNVSQTNTKRQIRKQERRKERGKAWELERRTKGWRDPPWVARGKEWEKGKRDEETHPDLLQHCAQWGVENFRIHGRFTAATHKLIGQCCCSNIFILHSLSHAPSCIHLLVRLTFLVGWWGWGVRGGGGGVGLFPYI